MPFDLPFEFTEITHLRTPENRIHSTSGYRPPDYNREVGGVSNSTHVDGLAADIYCDGLSTKQLHVICAQVIGKQGGVGYYPKSGYIHIDLRGYEARWSGF